MRRLLIVLALPLALSGCFGRVAHYEDDPADPKIVANAAGKGLPDFKGPTADVPLDRVAAFITIANPFLTKEMVRREAESITRNAAKAQIPVSLLVSLIAIESSFNPKAVSPVGAQGLGQLMPATAKDMGANDPFDPEQNIAATAKYLAWLGGYWGKHPRRWELALASYLAGVGTVGNQLKAGRDLTQEQAGYVRKIMQLSTRV